MTTQTPPPLVSCIVPAHNEERFIAQALQSICEQPWPAIEIIVADDRCTDKSAAIAAAFDARVRVVRSSAPGPAAARNAGLAAASGEFIAFLDADDLWLPQKIETQMERLLSDPGLDLCTTLAVNFWEDGAGEDDAGTENADARRARYGGGAMTEPWGGYSIITLVARRRIFDRVGTFDAALLTAENVMWFERAIGEGATLYEIPQVHARRRLHSGNTTGAMNVEQSSEAMLKLIKSRLDRRRSRT